MRAAGHGNQVLFIQGGGAETHDAWDDKLVDSLRRDLGDGFEVRYPRMPSEDDPSAAAWRPAIRQAVADLATAPWPWVIPWAGRSSSMSSPSRRRHGTLWPSC